MDGKNRCAGMDFEIHTTDYIINEYYKGEKNDLMLKHLIRQRLIDFLLILETYTMETI